MKCVFCKRDLPLTKEHVLPDWLANIYPRNIVVTNELVGENSRTWPSKIFQHKLKSVCSECNGGWMSELEIKMKPIFVSLCSNKNQTINNEMQSILATWAQKTVLMLNQATPGGVKITQDLYDDIYKSKSFSKKVMVCIGRRNNYNGTKSEPIASFTMRQIPSVELPKELEKQMKVMMDEGGFVWRSSLAIGPLVFDLSGHNMKIILQIHTESKALKIIRPYQNDIIWPIEPPIESEGGWRILSQSL